MTAARPVPAPNIAAVASRILPAGAPSASPGLTPSGQEDNDHTRLNLPAVITAAMVGSVVLRLLSGLDGQAHAEAIKHFFTMP